MARPRGFDTDRALDGAMDVFWQKGYAGASLNDLLAGMGIARGSFYKAFSDKKSLFLLILERYRERAVLPAVADLSDATEPDGLARIEALFARIIADVRAGDRRGCLLCSAAAGPATDDPEIAGAVRKLLDEMRGGFRAALAARPGQAPADLESPTATAQTLQTLYDGHRLLTRANVPADHLEMSVSELMALLKTRR